MPESGWPCSHDCFHCPFEDCIAPDDDLLTAEEIRRSERLDKETYILNCEADYEGEEARRKRVSDTKRRYRQTHRAEIAEYEARRRVIRHEAKLELDRRYYEAHKEQINARKRELRAMSKFQKQQQQQQRKPKNSGGKHGKTS